MVPKTLHISRVDLFGTGDDKYLDQPRFFTTSNRLRRHISTAKEIPVPNLYRLATFEPARMASWHGEPSLATMYLSLLRPRAWPFPLARRSQASLQATAWTVFGQNFQRIIMSALA
jgi:hypothetical protein